MKDYDPFENAITVAGLIDLLGKFPPDAYVFLPVKDDYYSDFATGARLLRGEEVRQQIIRDVDTEKVTVVCVTGVNWSRE